MREHPWVLLFILLVFLVTAAAVASMEGAESPSAIFSVKPPSFFEHVRAGSPGAYVDITKRIKGEAGISAYYKTLGPIDLGRVREHFNTIEIETPDYILGSMSVPAYPEVYDAHVYIHRYGWVLAYYFATDPIAKMIDVKTQDICTTKLKGVVSTVVAIAGMPFGDVTYYDFRHPNATHMMFVAEHYDAGDNNFTVMLPSTFSYYERSWALGDAGGNEFFTVNGVNKLQPPSPTYWDGTSGYGFIKETEMLPNTTHVIAVDEYGVLVLLYRAPE